MREGYSSQSICLSTSDFDFDILCLIMMLEMGTNMTMRQIKSLNVAIFFRKLKPFVILEKNEYK